METLLPRDQIPQSWLEKSRCPYCSSAPMVIEHIEGNPDQFVCPTCELTFQVAQNSSSVFVIRDPLGVKTGYEGQWVEMKTLIQDTHSGITPKEPVKAPLSEPITTSERATHPSSEEPAPVISRDPIYEKYSAEVIENAADLYAMGNSKQQIKETLSKYSKLADEDIEEILNYITRKKTAESRRAFKIPRWALGFVIVPFVCLLAYALIVFIQYRASSTFAPGAAPKQVTVFEYANLPKAIRDLIPEEVQSVQMPSALVTQLKVTGGEVKACPADGETAAELFGGEALAWQFNTAQQAWMMQSVYAQTIIVPEGYLSVIPNMNKGLSIQLVPGPARVMNAYLLLVRCP
jgi:hypothetical protein